MKIVLNLKKKVDKILDLEFLTHLNNDDFTKKSFSKLSTLYGTEKVLIKDFFDFNILDVEKTRNHFVINGSNRFFKNLGFLWENHILEINGNSGDYLGAKMRSGQIKIKGFCGNFLGSEMQGGTIEVSRDAGDFVGSPLGGGKNGMNGGQIFIKGNAGKYLGQLMRRGFIVVKGDVEKSCCFHMIAGTVVIGGNITENYSNSMKRGSLILLSHKVKPLKNFVEVDIKDSSFIGYLKKFLRDNYKLKINRNHNLKRYVGDRNNSGFGEIICFECDNYPLFK